MGCTPAKGIKGQKLPQYINYVQAKDKVFNSPKFIFIKFFYEDLFYVAQNIIKITSNFDDLVGSFDLAAEALQQLGHIDDMAEIAQVLAILPKVIQPMIMLSKDPLFSSLYSAKKFAQKYHDFQDDLFVLFKLLPAIEKAKILEPKSRYRFAIHILNCLEDSLYAIDVCDYDKQSLTPFKKLIKLISPVRKVMGLIMKLNKYLNSKVMGISVMSLLGGGGGGLKKTMVKMAIKGLCLPIKAVIKKIIPDSGKIFKYEFQCTFQKPESGWLKLHYAIDKKAKKLDLYNCIQQQWAKQHLGQLYSQSKVKQYERIHMPQVKFEIKQGQENEGDLVGEKEKEKEDFGEIKKDQQPTDEISTGCQNTVPAVMINEDDVNEQDREAAIKEVEKSINHMAEEFNEISKSIRDNKFQNVEKDYDELSWNESNPEIAYERNHILQIPLEKRKTGTGSVLSKSFLLVP